MKFKDSLKFALHNLTTRKLRSWLTILGVIIGVASIVAIVSVGQGMQDAIESQIGGLGGDMVFVMPGTSFEGSMMSTGAKEPGDLTDEDIKIIRAVEGVGAVAPDLIGMQEISYLNDKKTLYVWGTDENFIDVRSNSLTLYNGRFLSKGDKGVAVVGYRAAKDAFEKEVYVGSQIKISDKQYAVIGILNELGGFGGQNEDNSIFLTVEDAEEYSMFGKDKYYALEIRVEPERVEEIAEKIKEQLMIARHVNEENIDFGIMTPKMIASIATGIISILNFFLIGIAAISLIVGAVGIANTMFTSVTERTRQIGILKALGMNNKDIMNLFLVESALIGLVGGILGLLFGFILSGIIGLISSIALSGQVIGGIMMVSITWELIVFSLVFSVVIGVVSGLFPAKRASKLEPVVALRYE